MTPENISCPPNLKTCLRGRGGYAGLEVPATNRRKSENRTSKG